MPHMTYYRKYEQDSQGISRCLFGGPQQVVGLQMVASVKSLKTSVRRPLCLPQDHCGPTHRVIDNLGSDFMGILNRGLPILGMQARPLSLKIRGANVVRY